MIANCPKPIPIAYGPKTEITQPPDSSRTTLQNTNRSTVKVYYRFHPYAGQELEVIHNPVHACEWIIVRTPRGSSLKIPRWMVHPAASEMVISPNAILSASALAG